MKKLICLALSLLMLLSLTVLTVCAEEAPAADEAAIEAVTEALTEAVTGQDMGGIFSPARLLMAGQMMLLGVGMVFLVLAVLWGVLVIFKKVMYDAPQKKAAKAEAAAKAAAEADPAPAPAVEPAPASEEEDGAAVAAITAAIAAMIASDEQLSSQFVDGFRVVSFKKKSAARSRGGR